MFHPPLHSAQRSVGDFHPHAFADGGRQADLAIRLQRPQHLLQLPDKKLLVGDLQQIRQMVALMDSPPLLNGHLQKNVTWKERFLKHHGLAPILVNGAITGQRGGQSIALTKLQEFLLAPRPGMGDKPKQSVQTLLTVHTSTSHARRGLPGTTVGFGQGRWVNSFSDMVPKTAMTGREMPPALIVRLNATPDFFGLSIPAGVFQHSNALSIRPFVRRQSSAAPIRPSTPSTPSIDRLCSGSADGLPAQK
jgi:hypothetical protein